MEIDAKQTYRLTYLIVPYYIYEDDRLTATAIKVYGFIHSYTNPFFFGNKNLADMFHCSERSITEALSKLEEYGYITMKLTPKAGGGTTRLAVDCYSESQKSSSRKLKSEATTSGILLHKDIKVNNLKEEEPIENDLDLITPVRKADRVYKIGRGYQRPNPHYKNNHPEKVKKGGVDFSDIP